MTTHQKVLAEIVAELIETDADCSIFLRGSVATGEERPDSDIDLFVTFSKEPASTSPLINEGNRNA
jgi:predicted nucleotidyltransferase